MITVRVTVAVLPRVSRNRSNKLRIRPDCAHRCLASLFQTSNAVGFLSEWGMV
ncbi:hypothetical protein PI125_g19105 [Phytophthora idaei]|nr:hypothetical protein PI125_g19105 [Phytophthora idaei]